jgi:hypothetical protein
MVSSGMLRRVALVRTGVGDCLASFRAEQYTLHVSSEHVMVECACCFVPE